MTALLGTGYAYRGLVTIALTSIGLLSIYFVAQAPYASLKKHFFQSIYQSVFLWLEIKTD